MFESIILLIIGTCCIFAASSSGCDFIYYAIGLFLFLSAIGLSCL